MLESTCLAIADLQHTHTGFVMVETCTISSYTWVTTGIAQLSPPAGACRDSGRANGRHMISFQQQGSTCSNCICLAANNEWDYAAVCVDVEPMTKSLSQHVQMPSPPSLLCVGHSTLGSGTTLGLHILVVEVWT